MKIPNPNNPGTNLYLEWIKDIRPILYALLLITLMLARPQGLFTWPLWKKKSA